MANAMLAKPAANHLRKPHVSINSWEKITKKNWEKAAISSLRHPKLAEAYGKALGKLLCEKDGRYTYASELDSCAKKKGYSSGRQLLSLALSQLGSGELLADSSGWITNARELGGALSDVLDFLESRASIWVFVDEAQLFSHDFPLSKNHRQGFAEIIGGENCEAEAAVLMIVKNPPLPVAEEIRRIREKNFKGLVGWLKSGGCAHHSGLMSSELAGYLEFATVRVLATGEKGSPANNAARKLNEQLEEDGGVEEANAARVAFSLFEHEKNNSLRYALRVCLLAIAAINLLNVFAPGAMHMGGGIADDFFGSLFSSVSQSWNRIGDFWQRMRRAVPVIGGGLLGMGVSLGLAFASTIIYRGAAPLAQRIVAGALFSLACCAGTIGSTVGAVVKAYRELSAIGSAAFGRLGKIGKIREAMDEAVLRIPFRLGSALIGAPIQLLLGIAAGIFRFFPASAFIITEGVLETAVGALTAFAYPKLAWLSHMRKLKQL